MDMFSVLIGITFGIIVFGGFKLFESYKEKTADGEFGDDDRDNFMLELRGLVSKSMEQAVKLYKAGKLPKSERENFVVEEVYNMVQQSDSFTDSEKELIDRQLVQSILSDIIRFSESIFDMDEEVDSGENVEPK